MRLFVALSLPAAVTSTIRRAAEPLRQIDAPVRWVSAEALHVTLQFLGNGSDEEVRILKPALAGAAASHGPQRLDLGGIGMFPARGRPKVMWLGVRLTPELARLQADVARACETAGFPGEERTYRPHVTLGRLKVAVSRFTADRLRAVGETVNYRARVEVGTVDLIRSHLGRSGARYEVIGRLALGAVPADD